MTTRSWIRKLFARPVTPPIRKRPHRARLAVQALEDRTVPSGGGLSAAPSYAAFLAGRALGAA
jgi:hypothetical protein